VFINVLGSWHLSKFVICVFLLFDKWSVCYPPALGGASGAQATAVIVLSCCNALGRLSTGLCSDVTLHRVKRQYWILPNLVLLLVAFAICLGVRTSNPDAVIGVSVLIGLGYGGLASFLATVTADTFGSEFFGRNWSILDAFNGIGYLVLGQIAGAIYGARALESGLCVGIECYQYVWVMLLVRRKRNRMRGFSLCFYARFVFLSQSFCVVC
jgi:MFS family permease